MHKVALLLLAMCAISAQADEKILSFHSDITVNADASVNVVESITVRSEAQQIRRGIYRDFPTRYRDSLGNNYEVAFDVLSVLRDGEPEPWHTKVLDNGARLYIGDKDTRLPPAIYRYEIHYRTNNQLGYFDGYDELYWNVTGNDWQFAIEQASATVVLPVAFNNGELRTSAYSGYVGQTTSDVTVSKSAGQRVDFESRAPLLPREGLTIAVGWPPGAVYKPTEFNVFVRTLSQNRHLLIYLAGLLLVLGYYITVWRRYGRDPESRVVIPIYAPPENDSPGAVRFVYKSRYDQKTFTTAIVSLAVKGYLTIREDKKKEFAIVRTGKAVDFSAGEKALVKRLFSAHDEVLTTTEFRKDFAGAMAAHQSSLKSNYRKRYYRDNGLYVFFGLMLCVTTLAAGVVLRHPFANIAVATAVTIGLLLLIQSTFAWLMKSPTELGQRYLEKLAGLKQYLTLAEGDDLRARYPLERTPETFERFLPYAFALDIEDTWVDQFDDVMARAFVGADGQSRATPLWYFARGDGMASLRDMTTTLDKSFSSSVSSAAKPPGSSSGSGGGGSSGGGGGGGGGGGW